MVDMVSFTGSTGVGKLTMAAAAQIAEESLAGTRRQEPADRLPRCRPRRRSSTPPCSAPIFNAGECCNAGSRLIVHKAIADDFMAAVKALTAKVTVGDPLDAEPRSARSSRPTIWQR